jgi:hypothetical protein
VLGAHEFFEAPAGGEMADVSRVVSAIHVALQVGVTIFTREMNPVTDGAERHLNGEWAGDGGAIRGYDLNLVILVEVGHPGCEEFVGSHASRPLDDGYFIVTCI